MQHVSKALMGRLDDAIDEALAAVQDGAAAKATVGVTFSIGRDKEGDLACQFALKAGTTETGDWEPARQARLPMEEGGVESVTLASGDRSVTLTAAALRERAEAAV